MKKYNNKKGKSIKEKVGFYVALSVCVVAVAMAVWSTYSNYNSWVKDENNYNSSLSELKSGTDETKTTIKPTESSQNAENNIKNDNASVVTNNNITDDNFLHSDDNKNSNTAKQTDADSGNDAPKASALTQEDIMQTALKLDLDLSYPVKQPHIICGFSEQCIYNKTMKDYRAHTGIDLSAKNGEDVTSMCAGKVDSVYKDALLGNVVKVTNGDIAVLYCGLADDTAVGKGDSVSNGDVIGKVGTIPFESADDSHIHIEILVKNQYVDPLTLIAKNE